MGLRQWILLTCQERREARKAQLRQGIRGCIQSGAFFPRQLANYGGGILASHRWVVRWQTVCDHVPKIGDRSFAVAIDDQYGPSGLSSSLRGDMQIKFTDSARLANPLGLRQFFSHPCSKIIFGCVQCACYFNSKTSELLKPKDVSMTFLCYSTSSLQF